MKPSLLAIRSIGSEFAQRLYTPVAVTIAVIAVVLVGVSVWLTTISAWWWILFALLCGAILVTFVALVVIMVLITLITPARTKAQKQQTKEFVDKLQRVSDAVYTPKFILLFQIARDMVLQREKGYITSLSNETTSLGRDFVALSRTFKS